MTRKHFTAIAMMLRNNLINAQNEIEAETIARITRNLAHHFSQINGSFRYDLFYSAAGLEPDGYRTLVPVAQ